MNLATIILLIALGVIIGTAFCKSPQRKYTYSGDARKKKLTKPVKLSLMSRKFRMVMLDP